MNKIIFVFALFLVTVHAFAVTIHVGKGHVVSSVKQGIKKAMDGDTVLVHPGTYKEGNIVVDKRICLKGINYPMLDGQLKYEVISVKAKGAVITGLKVCNSGYASLDDPGGIKVYDSENVTISNNILDNNFFGVYIQYGKNCTIKDNKITAYGKEEQQIGNGIHCWKSEGLRISGNTISGHRDGIYFEFVSHSVIWRNTSFNNIRYGLHFMFSNDDAYISNVFTNNGAGVAVMFTRNVKMYDNTFNENWGDASYGLLLKEISDSYIYKNRFVGNTSAIYMEGTNRIIIENNIFKDNGWGMKVQASCMDNVIRKNNFQGNTFDVSTNGSLVMNVFENNYWDKYEGYDLNKDNTGDVPYRPLSLFSVIVETNPPAMLLYRSFIISLLDRSEKIIPTLTPENFIDNTPLMHALDL